MKKHLLSILIVLFYLNAQAYDFLIDGIYYKRIDAQSVEVTYLSWSVTGYSGDVVIPPTIETPNQSVYSVIAIGDNAFYGCSDVSSVSLPFTISQIKSYAFADCTGLTEIILPANLKSLEDNTFVGCSNLTKVVCFASQAPAWNKGEYDDTFDYATIYVGSNALSNYRGAENWDKQKLDNYYTLYVNAPTTGDVTFSKIADYYLPNEEVTVTATAKEGYHFTKWSDGNTENPRTVIMNQDYSFSPQYEQDGNAIEGIDGSEVNVFASNGTLFIENVPADEKIAIYNLLGHIVKTAQIQEGNNSFSLTSGIYLVKYSGKIVKVQL